MTTLSKCCVSGHLHKGTPQGIIKEYAGLKTYITGDNKAESLIMITDVYGVDLPNVKTLADEYASAGQFRVLVPDFFKGDAVPIHHLKVLNPLHSDATPKEDDKQTAFADVGPWLGRHDDASKDTLFKQVFAELKGEEGVKRTAVVGFCWGGRHAVRLTGMDIGISAAVANHPSFTEFPETFEQVKVPTLVQVGTNDSLFPEDQVQGVKDKIFPSKEGCKLVILENAVHGFGIRGDLNNDEERKLKDQSVQNAVDFFKSTFV